MAYGNLDLTSPLPKINYDTSSQFTVSPLGGQSSLGGAGYRAYQFPGGNVNYKPKTDTLSFSSPTTDFKSPALAQTFAGEDAVSKSFQEERNKNYDKDLKRTDNDSSNTSGFTDAQKKMGAQKEAWGGTSYDWDKMGAENQMGVINAGFNMAGLIGNFFTK